MFPKPDIPFVNCHTALTEAATGDTAALDARLAELETLIRAGRYNPGYTMPLAIVRHRRGALAGRKQALIF